jgi:hypothetical protein
MKSLTRYICISALTGLCLAVASGAYASVGSINSVIISHVFNDMPGATVTPVNSYPGPVTLSESGVTRVAPGGLNRDVWRFSNNGGASAYQFQGNDYFNASFTLTLSGGENNIDLEGGFLFSNPSGNFGGDDQIVVVGQGGNAGVEFQSGGPSFHLFAPNGTYVNGTPITMGFNYVIDPNTSMNAFQYSVNGVFGESSPGNTYFDLGAGQFVGGAGDVLGGYFQIGNGDANNAGQAVFGDITITSVVPEPATFALVGMGLFGLLAIRRKR